MGLPPALISHLQAAGVRALELLALRQSILAGVPPCPAVSLACLPANVTCPPQVCPALTCAPPPCPPPACPPPLVNLSCPPAGLVAGAGEFDLPSACWGGLAGIAAGLGLGRAASRRGRSVAAGEDDDRASSPAPARRGGGVVR